MNAVVRNLHSLGRVAQQQGFSGPTLGARLATTNRRSFTAEQMAEVRVRVRVRVLTLTLTLTLTRTLTRTRTLTLTLTRTRTLTHHGNALV